MSGMGGGFGFLQQQYLATSFTLDSNATIASLGAYLYKNGTGSVTYQLREGHNPLGDLLYSDTLAGAVSTPNYYTLSALDWGVTADDYTLNFIPDYGFDGGLFVGAPGTPNTTLANHVSTDGGGSWNPDGHYIYGLQIFGTETTDPDPVDPDPAPEPDPDTGPLAELSRLLGAIVSSTAPPDITAIAGAINLASLDGAIDISGTHVRIAGVAARADAIGNTTSNATAIALNGTQLATTVIGAMNSATLDTLGKTTERAARVAASLGVACFAASSPATFALPAVSAPGTDTDITLPLPGAEAFAALTTGATSAVSLQGLSASLEATGRTLAEQVEPSSAFNMALNVAPIAAGVRVAATVDATAWFLNPQTGVVDLANLEIASTAIGAMNSSLTHLGQRPGRAGPVIDPHRLRGAMAWRTPATPQFKVKLTYLNI